MLIGNVNARLGASVRGLLPVIDCYDFCQLSYPEINGDISVANGNAEILSVLCKDNKLLVWNILKTLLNHFVCSKTCRKRGMDI